MTNWLPDLQDRSGPLYIKLADRIEADIAAGVLPKGSKLPPQRNLAYDIGVTIGTIGRAYALARERGLVSGEIGRGTYVLGREGPEDGTGPVWPPQHPAIRRHAAQSSGKTRMDSTAAPEAGQAEVLLTTMASLIGDYPEEAATY